jgi:hypothetical protein
MGSRHDSLMAELECRGPSVRDNDASVASVSVTPAACMFVLAVAVD